MEFVYRLAEHYNIENPRSVDFDARKNLLLKIRDKSYLGYEMLNDLIEVHTELVNLHNNEALKQEQPIYWQCQITLIKEARNCACHSIVDLFKLNGISLRGLVDFSDN